MGVDAGVSGSACKVFPIFIGDVLAIRVFEALCKSEVYDEDTVFGLLCSTDKEIIRLDISVDYSLVVHFLDPLQLNQQYN
jgi:hypothetical protein